MRHYRRAFHAPAGRLLFCISILCVPASGFPQQSSDAQPSYTLRLDSQLVQLDVVVRNAKGDLVTGLRRDDFSVLEDNVPQTIVSFEATNSLPAKPGSIRIDSTAELDRREPGAPVTILVLDELSSRFEDQYFARQANQLQVSFPVSAIGLALSGDKLTGDVTFIALSYDRGGKLLASNGRVISLRLAPLPASQVDTRNVLIATALDPHLPAARIRLVVRANANGKIGADNFFLVDPRTLRDRETGLKPQKQASR